MLSARPLPDEFIAGHIGRLARLNDIDSLERMIIRLTGDRDGLSPLVDPLEIYQSAAAVAEMSGQEYLARHTLFPIERFCADSDAGMKTYEEQRVYRQRTTILQLDRPLRLCPECVRRDIQLYGFSYWHRTHLILGVEWCVSHLNPLLTINSADGYAFCPAHWLSSAKEPPGDPQADSTHPIIGQYAFAACWLLQQGQRSTRARVGAFLSNAIQLHGLQSTGHGNKFRLSDLVRTRLPAEWLARHFPKIAQGQSLRYCPAIDAAVFGTRCHACSILLALSTLQATTTPHLHQLTSAENTALRARSIHETTTTQRRLSAYIECQGNLASMSGHNSCSQSAVVKFCRKHGLPSLRYADVATKRMILSFLVEASDEERKAWQDDLRTLLLATRQPSARWLRENAIALLPSKYRT